ncbi:hypothetical protein ABPG73_011052 [Tetrahymena malaccensis]
MKQMTKRNKSILSYRNIFLILNITLLAAQTSSSGCINNCQVCQGQVCLQCNQDYTLNSQLNICVYQNCQKGMALQQSINSAGAIQYECVAICQQQQYLNSQTNTCQPLSQCSSSYFTSTSSSTNSNTVIDLKILNASSFLAFYSNTVQQISAETGQLDLTLSYGAQAIKSQYFNGLYYIFRTDNSVLLWEIEIDKKSIISQIQFGVSIIDSQLISISEQIGAYLTFDVLNSIIYVNPLINLANNQILQNPVPLKVSYVNNSYFIQQNLIFVFSSKSLIIYSIQIDQFSKLTSTIQLSVNSFANTFSNVINAIYQNAQNVFFIITQNASFVYRCQSSSCNTVNLPSQPKKMIQSVSSQQKLNIIIQCQINLLVYDDSLSIILQLNLNNQILDFAISYITQNNMREIYLLTNNQQLTVYQENQQSNQILFAQADQIKVYSQQLQNLITINQGNGLINYLAIIGNGMQIINKANNQQIISSQFQPNYITNLGVVTDILIFDDLNTLATCSKEGRLFVWDITKIYDAQYSYVYYNNQDSCLKLYRLSVYYIVALFQNTIVILDIRQTSPLKVIKKNNPNPLKEFIATNNNLGILIYDGMLNCIGSDTSLLFSTNDPNLTQNIFNIYISYNNLLFLSYQNQMKVFKVDPTQNTIQNQITAYSIYNCQNKINVQMTKIKPFPQSLYSQVGYTFEVVMFDTSSSFYIFDEKFNVLQQVNQVPLISAVDFNFLLSNPLDPNYFVMGYTTQQTAAFKFQVYNIQKGVSVANLAAFIVQGTYLMEPRKVPNRPSQYDLEIVIPLSYFTADNIFRYDTNVTANVYQMGKQIQNEIQSTYKTFPDLSYNFFGGQSGFVGVSPLNTNYVKQVFSLNSNDIVNVQQSYSLGVYFVISKKIQIVNIHTNSLIEEILFNDSTQQTVQGFQVFADLQIAIAFKSSQLILKNFKNGITYSYTNINNLSFYKLEKQNQLITVFGSKVVKLQFNLNEYQQIGALILQSSYIVGCVVSSVNYYCKLQDGTMNIITQSKLNILNSFQNKFLGKNYNFQLDETNNQLFLFNTSIYVYDLTGIYQLQLTQTNGVISIFSLCTNDISYVTASSVTVMSRGSLVQRAVISSPGGGNIQQLMFLPNQNHILFFTTQMRYGQIFVYSLSSLLQVTSIKNTYTQNPISLTCAMIYDIFQNYLVYIDLTGNILIISYTGAYSMINFLKMNQFDDGFSAPIGFSLDFDMNNILVYSSSNIYQIPYSSINLWYNRIINYPKNQYFSLKNGANSEQFFIVGTSNILYSYQNNQFQSFNYFNEDDSFSSVSYIPDQQLLIVAFTQQINIYQQFSSNNLSLANKVIITGYRLKEFITPSIFLTFDNSIIDYNFSQNVENKKITWNLGIFITKYLWLNSTSLIAVGFNTGDVLFYNYKLQIQSKVKVDSNPIIYIQEGLNSIWVCSVIGVIQQINTTSYTSIQSFNLASSVTLQQTDKVNVFSVDEQNQRIFVSLLEQYLLYVFSYSTQVLQIQQYLSFPHHEKNNIYFSINYLMMYSTSQVNIHSRTSLQFLKSLKRENNFDQIMTIYLVSETYLIIPFQRKLELFSYDPISNSLQFIDQIVTILPQVIKVEITSNGQQLQLIGFSNNMVFENRYTVQLISSQSTQCSLSINVQDYQSTQQQLSQIPPTTVPNFTWQNRITVTSSNSNNYFYMNMFSANLDLVSAASAQNSLLVIQSPINNSNNNLINGLQTINLNNQTFAQFSKQQVLFNNLQIQLIDISNSKQSIAITFNSIVKQVNFQNIVIPNQQTLSQSQFQFNNMNSVVFKNIILDQWNLIQNLRNLQQSQQTTTLQQQNQNQGFFNFQNCSSVFIYGVSIKNSIINSSNFSTIFLFNTINEVILQDVYIENLQTIAQLATFQNVQKITIKNLTISNSSQFIQSSQSLNQFIIQIIGCKNTNIQNSLFSSNKNMLFLNTKNYFTSNQQLVYLESDELNLLNIKLENNQNLQQNTGQAIISISSSINTLDTLNMTQNQFNIQFQSTVSIQILNSHFQNNTGINGGALSIINNNGPVVIKNSLFLFNKALGSGGAIYLNLAQGSISVDQSNQISNNTAIIGGGVRLYSQINSIIVSLDKSAIQNNQADIYGNNFATFLHSVFVSCSNMNCIFNESNNQLSIERFNSGDTAHISIVFLDQDGRSMKFDPSKVDSNSYPSEIIEEIKSYQLQVTTSLSSNQQINVNGENFISYNRFQQNTSAFELNNFQILSIPETSQEININYQILPTKIQQLSSASKNYQILTNIQFRECLVGEVMKAYSQTIFSCQKCSQGTYSLAETDLIMQSKEGQIQCKKCPDSATSCEGNQIQVKNSYWRMNDTTDEIIYCLNNPNSCKFEDKDNKKGCIKGYVGPLCETCDIIGDIWQGSRYTNSLSSIYECSECSSLYYQIIFIVLSIGLLSIYFLMSLEIFMNNFYHSQLCHYLRFLQIIPISQSQIKDRSSLYIKILTNYIQNSSVLINFSYYFIPNFISVIPNSFGQPSNKLVIGLQCLISSNFLQKNGILQTISIFQSIIPLVFNLLLTLLLLMVFLVKRGKFQKAKFYTLFNILFVFFQPDQVTFLTKLLSCRQIGSTSYASQNLLLLCEDDNYKQFQRKFAIPLLIFWIGMPVIAIVAIFKRRMNLNTCYTQYRFGYFTTGFKQKFYYWEFIRMYLKILVVLIFTIYNSNLYITYLIIILIFFGYIKIVLSYDPFQSKSLSNMEIASYTILIINVTLQIFQQEYNSIFLQILSAIIHIWMILYLILVIVFIKINDQSNNFGKLLRCLLRFILPQKYYVKLTSNNKISFKTFLLWKKIRKNIKLIILKKAFEKVETSDFVNLDVNNLSHKENIIKNFSKSIHNSMRLISNITSQQNDVLISPINNNTRLKSQDTGKQIQKNNYIQRLKKQSQQQDEQVQQNSIQSIIDLEDINDLNEKKMQDQNIRKGSPLKVIQKQNPNPAKEFITTNKNLGILIYDNILNCIGSDGSLIFTSNDPSHTQDIYNIYLSDNNLLFFQYQSQMKVYKVDPTQKVITIYSTYNSPSKIKVQLTKIKPFPESLYLEVGYTFEVLMFDTISSFYIFDEKFNVLQQVNQVPLMSAVDFNFLLSTPLDPNYFVMGYTTQQTAAFKMQVYNIQKGIKKANYVTQMLEGALLMNPRKVANQPDQYDIELALGLSYFSANNVYRYAANTAGSIIQLARQIQNEIQTTFKTFPDNSYNFVGANSGFVGLSPLNTNYVKQVFYLSSSDIINVQQSLSLDLAVLQRGSLYVRTIISSPEVSTINLDTLEKVTQIYSMQTQNSIPLPVAMIYDLYQNYHVYIDNTGYIIVTSYQGAYSLVHLLKVNSFGDGLSAQIGFSLDYDMNNLLVYNSSYIYQIPYSFINLLYNRIINYPKNQYFILNYGTDFEQYFIVGNSNILYSYQTNQFQSFNYFDEEDSLTSVNYISDQKLLIVAFTQQINLYSDFSSSNLSFSNKIIIKSYKLKEFITPNIFLTFDNSMIDYNFQLNTENYKLTWNLGVSITSSIWLNSTSLIAIGYSSGDLLLYNYQQLKQVDVKVDLTPIIFIYEGMTSVWVCSVAGIVQQIDSSSLQTIQTFNLSNTIPLLSTDKINVFTIDEQNLRIFVSILEQHLAYILQYSNNSLQIQQYLSFPHHERNNIYFSQNYIILYSTSQLNIHNRTSLQFLKGLKRENNFDQITQVYFVNENYLVISFLRKLELFSYDQDSNSLQFLDQIVSVMPQVIKIDIIQNGQQLQLIGFSNNTIFENRYTIQLISSSSTKCSFSVDVQNYTSTQQQISLIPPTTVPYFTWQRRVDITSLTQSNYFYMNMLTDNLETIDFSNIQNSQIVIQSVGNSNNQMQPNSQIIKLSNATFAQYTKSQLLLNSLQFQLIDSSNSNQAVVIAFNSNVNQVNFQDIDIPNQNTLSQAQFQFSNISNIVFNNIILNKWNLIDNLQQQKAQKDHGFFHFQNCSSIYLYGITINNSLINNSQYSTLFYFNTIDEVIIEDFQIFDLQTSVQLAVLQSVQKITIKNLTISNSQFISFQQNNQIFNSYMLQIIGCQNTSIQDSSFSSNQNMLILKTQNYYNFNQQLIYLEKDMLNMLNVKIEKNQRPKGSQYLDLGILSISSSINNLDGLVISYNELNIQFYSTIQINIQNSNFQNNFGINGGALSIINNRESIIVCNSSFSFNQAQGSGGAIYLNLVQGSVIINQTNRVYNNTAKIGGGIRLYSQLSTIFTKIDKGIISNNNADIYGDNFATFLKTVFIYCTNMHCIFDSVSNQLNIERFGSGGTAQLALRFIDEEGRALSFDPLEINTNSYPSEIIDEIKSYYVYVICDQAFNEKLNINGENLVNYNRFSKNNSAFELNNFQIFSIPETTQVFYIIYQILPTRQIVLNKAFRSIEQQSFINLNALNQTIQDKNYSQTQSPNNSNLLLLRLSKTNSIVQNQSSFSFFNSPIKLQSVGKEQTHPKSHFQKWLSNSQNNETQDIQKSEHQIFGTVKNQIDSDDTIEMHEQIKIQDKTPPQFPSYQTISMKNHNQKYSAQEQKNQKI